MPTTFAYKVRDRSGKLVSGTLEADSQSLVIGKLREMGYAPVSVEEERKSLGQKEIKLPWGNKVDLKDIAIMARQFATMISSGLSLIRALNILADQGENKVLCAALSDVRAEVEKGASLSGAVAKHPKVFNRLFISMIRAGETGGVLDDALLRMADTFEKEVALKAKIKSAMTYPVVVMGMVIMIVSAMLIFVVPMFKTLYADLGGTLPLPTRMLIGISDLIKKGFFIWPPVIMGAVYAFRKWKATDRGRARWDAIKLKAPVFGTLVHKTALARFARTLSALMRSGVPILQSLDIVRETVNNEVVADAVLAVQTSVKEGASLAKPLEKHDVFPSMVVQMMMVGEETGALDTMLEKIADFYDQEVNATVEALTSLIEPLLIAFMGAAVGAMVVALYMPMFNIINLVQ